jgi:hypothetical protein
MTQRRQNLDAEFAALSQQVAGIENDYRDLKGVVVALDKKIEGSNVALSTKIDTSFAALAVKFDARDQINWGPIATGIGVVVAAMVALGGLAMQPGKDAITGIQAEMKYDRQRVDDTVSRIDRLSGLLSSLGAKQ